MNEKDNLLRHIKNLLEMVADDSATIELQAAQLEQYAKMLDDERAAVAQLRENIVQLRAQLSQRSVTLARYKHAYQAEKNMFEDCETLRQAEMATIAQLRAQLAAVPVDSLRRYCDCIAYDGGKSFHSIPLEYDELQITMWFESLEDAA